MKKIINGKRYDTDTAKRMGANSYSHPGDFSYWSETLYRKRNGEFFLHGAGGPQTRYAERVDSNCWSGGSKIFPMTYAEAQQWAEQNLTCDEYEEIFGEVEEGAIGDEKITTTLSLTPEAREMLVRLAGEANTSLSATVEDLIRNASK